MVNKPPGLANQKFLVASFLLAVLIFFLILVNPFQFYFLNDDFVHIPLAAKSNFLHGNLLRPVADISLWVDSALYGKNAAGFHFTNILIHLANTVLVYLFYNRYLVMRGVDPGMRPVLASALFLIYAFHSESVFWILGRGGSLACLFVLLSLNCFQYSKSLPSLLFALCSFALGLFTYEFSWVLPLLIVIFGISEPGIKRKDLLFWPGCFLLMFGVYLIVRLNLASVHFSSYESGLIQQANLSRLFYNYVASVARSFLPPMQSGSAFLIGFVAFLAVVISTILIKRKHKTGSILPLVLAILFSCLPSISLGIDTHDQEGERFLYLSSVFCSLFLVEFVFLFIGRAIRRVAVLTLIFLVHGYYFYMSSHSYRFASSVVEQSFQCLADAKPAAELDVVGLPTQYKGALIFRKGFENAVEWLMPGRFGSVKINSVMELFKDAGVQCITKGKNSPDKRLLRFDEEGNIYIE